MKIFHLGKRLQIRFLIGINCGFSHFGSGDKEYFGSGERGVRNSAGLGEVKKEEGLRLPEKIVKVRKYED